MKFAWKIFFVSFLITILSFGTGGFLLLNSVFSSTLENKIQNATDSNSYVTVSLYAIFTNAKTMGYDEDYRDFIVNSFSSQVASGGSDTKVRIGNLHTVTDFDDSDFAKNIRNNTRAWRVVQKDDNRFVQAVSRIRLGKNDYYVQSLTDITDIYKSRDDNFFTYQIILMFVALFASTVLVLFSRYITRPLVKLSYTAQKIADGDFSKRAEPAKTKEISELSQSFNSMAQYAEEYIEQLKISAQSRDDFVADFTHELKTPLTSVIGYADMLKSFDLDTSERRKCADLIYKEAKRLEALSTNLLNIIVLKKDSISLSAINTQALTAELIATVEFLLKKYGVTLDAAVEKAEIKAEPSLLKTLIYNLIDNACKASKAGQSIRLSGEAKSERYRFTITDNGCGIPKDEVEKITRPFYMVDKSRSRSMGGAGLGLSLCSEIAKLHSSQLEIKSEVNKGTSVSFTVELSLYKDGELYE